MTICSYGTDLLEQIKQNTFFKEDDGREIMRSVAEAIVYLHSKSVIHADLRVQFEQKFKLM